MAQNLNEFIGTMNQTAPEIQRLSRQTSADLEKVGLVLIEVLLTGSVLSALVYTFLTKS